MIPSEQRPQWATKIEPESGETITLNGWTIEFDPMIEELNVWHENDYHAGFCFGHDLEAAKAFVESNPEPPPKFIPKPAEPRPNRDLTDEDFLAEMDQV